MKFFLLFVFIPLFALGQQCAPVGALQPTSTVMASFDSNNCQFADGTPYAEYTLTVPARGSVQIDTASTQGDLTLMLRGYDSTLLDSGKTIRRQIERGTYAVIVYTRPDAPARDYSVRSVFTAEAGVLCRDFASIGPSQTVSAQLGSSGCRAPDGSLYEAWALHTYAAGTLTVTVSSPEFSPALTVRSADGYAIQQGDTSFTLPLEGDSDFQIVVAGQDSSQGAYQLTTSFTAASGDPCHAQSTLTDSTQFSASISSQSCSTVANSNGDQIYFDLYNVQVTQAGMLELHASASTFNPVVRLFDASGATLATDVTSAGAGHSLIHIQVRPGTYLAQISSPDLSGGNYLLQYRFAPGAPVPCTILPAGFDTTVKGNLAGANCRTFLGSSDMYTVTLPSSGSLTVSMSSTDFNTVLAIRDAHENVVVLNDNLGGVSDSYIAADLPAGTYTIVAGASEGFGNYTMTPKFTAHDIPACPVPQDLPPNSGYIQRLGAGNCRGKNGEPVDWYQFTLPSDGTVAAVLTSSEIDGFLSLISPAGNVVREDDNSYGDNDPLFIEYLPAGTYQLGARAVEATLGGLYRVDVLFTPGPPPPGCASRATLAVGSVTTGRIGYTGCQYVDNTFADIYQINLTDPTALDIHMDSEALDAYLVVLDSKGNVVDQDDDSGGDTNARVQHSLDPGTYYIVAKPLNDYASAGVYTLTIKTAQ